MSSIACLFRPVLLLVGLVDPPEAHRAQLTHDHVTLLDVDLVATRRRAVHLRAIMENADKEGAFTVSGVSNNQQLCLNSCSAGAN